MNNLTILSKVKFTNNDETKVVIQDPAASPTKKANLYPALTKAELMHYATDPFWVKLRWGRVTRRTILEKKV